MAEFRDGEKKAQLVQAFEQRVREELREFTPPCATPKVFTIPIDDSTRAAELGIFKTEANMLPEEYYLYSLNKILFTEVFEQASEDDADVLFLPMHVPVYSLCDVNLGDHLRESEVLRSPKPKLFVYSWDTYPRPPFERANPFCPLSQRIVGLEPFYSGCREWLDESWHVAVTESTIDLHPNDFGMPALVGDFTSRLAGGLSKRFLYSFCGVMSYSPMPHTHVRGANFQPAWQKLANTPAADVFAGELDDAQQLFGSDVSYRDFSRNSTFTLCPAGWARWSFRLSEAIADGSIPVILSDYYQLPFEPWVQWSEFSLRLPEASLPQIDEILRAIPAAKVASLQRGLRKWQPEFSIQGYARNICRAAARVLLP